MVKCFWKVGSDFRWSLIFEQGQVTQSTRNENVTWIIPRANNILYKLTFEMKLPKSIHQHQYYRSILIELFDTTQKTEIAYQYKKKYIFNILWDWIGLDWKVNFGLSYLIKHI